MKVLLTETIDSLGIIGSEVNVAKGYARNYLIPQKKALIATPQNRKTFPSRFRTPKYSRSAISL